MGFSSPLQLLFNSPIFLKPGGQYFILIYSGEYFSDAFNLKPRQNISQACQGVPRPRQSLGWFW